MRTVILILATLVACSPESPSRTSPKSAFSRIGACVDGGGARCLYRELDRDSRWSIQTIHRLLTEGRQLVDRSYPNHLRSSALGTWDQLSRAQDAADAFALFCSERKCMEQVARGFGAVVDAQEPGPGTATLRTTRGTTFAMANADGEWGLATYSAELKQGKLHLFDVLKQVRVNATDFDDQSLATGKGVK